MRLRVVDHGEDTPDVGSEFARNPRHHLRVLLLVELTTQGVSNYSSECMGSDGSRIPGGGEVPTARGIFLKKLQEQTGGHCREVELHAPG